MTRLELAYRFLMQAYPASHRERYEDEMVAVLLDADTGRGRLSLRQATAIVAAGIHVRLRADGELYHGLRLATVGAMATLTALATVALSLSLPQAPPLSAAVPAAMWLVAVAVALFAARADSNFRVAPAAALVLVMVLGGAELMGFKRSVLAAAALCLLFTSVAPRLESRRLALASAVGITAGLVFSVPNQAALDNWAPLSAGPWAADAQWQYSAYSLDSLSVWLAAPILAAGLLALRWRARYIVAASLLSIALWLPVTLTPGGYFWPLTRPMRELIVSAGAALALIVLGLAIALPWRTQRPRPPYHPRS
jgi:hypothetical protein